MADKKPSVPAITLEDIAFLNAGRVDLDDELNEEELFAGTKEARDLTPEDIAEYNLKHGE